MVLLFFLPSHLFPPSDCKLDHTYCFLNIIVSHVSVMCFIAAGGCCGTIIKHFFLPPHFLPPSGCKLNHHLNALILS